MAERIDATARLACRLNSATGLTERFDAATSLACRLNSRYPFDRADGCRCQSGLTTLMPLPVCHLPPEFRYPFGRAT